MKKWMYSLSGLTATALLLGVMPTSASLADTPQAPEVRLNNNTVNFPDAKPFVDANDRTMVPVRFIAEGMGAKVDWFELTNTVVIQMNGKDIRLHVGDDTATVNGTSAQLDTNTVMHNDRTYVPLRFVSETLGADVTWDGEHNLVAISFSESDGSWDRPTGGQTPDGQVDEQPPAIDGDLWGRATRTTNLPKNATDFPYILANVTNDMYEMPYAEGPSGKATVTAKTLFTQPEFTKENLDLWTDRLKTHYNLILNANYQTIDSTWADKLYDTQNIGGRFLDPMQEYVNWVKQNQIQIEGSIEPEPSMIYDNQYSYRIRSKVKFRIVNYKQDQNVIFDPLYKPGKFEKGVWYEGYVDVGMSTSVGGNWAPTLAVSNDDTLFWYNAFHRQ